VDKEKKAKALLQGLGAVLKRAVLACVLFACLPAGLFAQNNGGDAYEPDSRDRPVAAQMETWYSRALHGGDQDWFALRPASAGLLIAATQGDTDTVITLYRGDVLEARNDDNGDEVASLLEYPVSAGTEYLLCVEGYDGDQTGPYGFMVSFESIRDPGEPNDTAAQATAFSPGIRITAYFLDPDDEDWYSVTAASTGALTVYTEGTIDTVILMYDDKQTLIAEDDDSGEGENARVSARVTPGTVYVRVSSYDGQLGRYTLRGLFFEPAEPDRFEPDNSRILAQSIGVGESQERNFTDSLDEDWARLRITQRGTYVIFAEAGDRVLDTFLELYDSNNELVDVNDDWNDELNARLRLDLDPGVYFIRARTLNDDPIANSNYVLSVSR
jgi:hypothetical protein